MTFAALGLIDPLLCNLQALGYSSATPIQTQAIPAVLKGRDLLASAQTGTGKTAGFALPLLQILLQQGPKLASNSTRALVLVPTRELAEQLLQSFQRYGKSLPLRSYAVYGGVSINPQMMALRKGVDVLIATPGRLLDLYRQNAIKFGQLQMLVLDEADRMLDLGFADELDQVVCALPNRRQTLMFSATFTAPIRQLADDLLRDPLILDISPRNSAATSVEQWLVPVDKKRKGDLLLQLLRQQPGAQALVFVNTRKGVEQLVQRLESEGLSADAIHGDRPQPARLRALARLKAGEIQILVATDVAARGLDIHQLPLVVNFDLPINAEDYIHRIGRSGRAGSSGQAVSLVSADEVRQLAAIETLTQQLLERREQPEFSPEHRVPETRIGGQLVKKPKKPKKPKQGGKNKVHLGTWFEEN
ncbi:DEAD/DEAH box helicase [Halopseudomonas sp.]|uniref:DEAD/DEAH box helicase n=1 Tax=Halopseudomonas sp. TaxID=2901191 RepID=UPI003FA53313